MFFSLVIVTTLGLPVVRELVRNLFIPVLLLAWVSTVWLNSHLKGLLIILVGTVHLFEHLLLFIFVVVHAANVLLHYLLSEVCLALLNFALDKAILRSRSKVSA